MTDSEWIGIRDAARILDVHENTVRNLVKRELIRATAQLSRQRRVLRADVVRLRAEQDAVDVDAATAHAREALAGLRAAIARAETFLTETQKSAPPASTSPWVTR